MFQLTLFATCAIYAPIITISDSILYHTNINKAILSNKWYSIIYCILLFLCCAFLDIFCKKAVIHISYYRLWNSIPIVFIIQNVVIIIKRKINNLSQIIRKDTNSCWYVYPLTAAQNLYYLCGFEYESYLLSTKKVKK